MKRPDAVEVIEFPSGRIMECTKKILVAFAITFLISLSSAAYIKKDLDTAKNFGELNFNHGLRTLREKRQSEHFDLPLVEDNAAKLENLLEPEKVHDRRAIAEEIQEAGLKLEEQQKRSVENSASEENTQDEATSYKNIRDAVHALMQTGDEKLNENLPELEENPTDAGNKLKRYSTYPVSNAPIEYAPVEYAPAVEYPVTKNILGAGFLDDVTLGQLDGHSCEVEAFGFGHLHHSGLLTHKLLCELRKLHHYMRLSLVNLKSEFTLGPLVTEDLEDDGFSFYRHTPQLLEAIIKEPQHLLVLPEIIRDVVPLPSIFNALRRIGNAFFEVLRFVHNLIHGGVLHVLENFFFHHHLGLNLLRILHHFGKLNLLAFLGLTLPEDLIVEPIQAPLTVYDDELYLPEYRRSYQEVTDCFRGFSDGYFASGIHDLFRSGLRTICSPEVSSAITGFLPTIPFLNNFLPIIQGLTSSVAAVDVNPVVEGYVPAIGYGSIIGGIAPVETETVSTAVASASAAVDVAGPLLAPAVAGPYAGYGSLVGPVAAGYPAATETVASTATSTASATAAVGATPVVAGPAFGPYAGYGSLVGPVAAGYPAATETVASTATSTASATAAVGATPVVAGPAFGPYAGYGSVLGHGYPVTAEAASAAATTTVVESQPVVAAEPVVSYMAPTVLPTLSLFSYPPLRYAIPHPAVAETTAVAVAESAPAVVAPVVETVPEVVDCAPETVAVPVTETVTTTASASASTSAVSNVAAGPFHNAIAPAVATAASASSTATVSATDYVAEPVAPVEPILYPGMVETVPYAGFNYLGYPGYPGYSGYLGYPGSAYGYSPLTFSPAVAASSEAVSTATASVISRQNFNFVLPREKIIGVLGNDCNMLPGDIVAVTLRNKSILYGNVLDNFSPIRFSFNRPRPYGAFLRNGARVWNIMHSDFTDPECVQIFNDPTLLNIY